MHWTRVMKCSGGIKYSKFSNFELKIIDVNALYIVSILLDTMEYRKWHRDPEGNREHVRDEAVEGHAAAVWDS